MAAYEKQGFKNGNILYASNLEAMEEAIIDCQENSDVIVIELEEDQTLSDIDFTQYENGDILLIVYDEDADLASSYEVASDDEVEEALNSIFGED